MNPINAVIKAKKQNQLISFYVSRLGASRQQ